MIDFFDDPVAALAAIGLTFVTDEDGCTVIDVIEEVGE